MATRRHQTRQFRKCQFVSVNFYVAINTTGEFLHEVRWTLSNLVQTSQKPAKTWDLCLRALILLFLFQAPSIPDGQEIINRVFIGGLARDVSCTCTCTCELFFVLPERYSNNCVISVRVFFLYYPWYL